MIGERNEAKLYPFTQLGFNLEEVQEQFDKKPKQLSLFNSNQDEQEVDPYADLDRPITPVDDQVKGPPSTFNGLAKLIRRRITTRSNIEHMSQEDQQALAAVIMGEVNGMWPIYRQQVADPFMSSEENKELQRRITVHIVTVCEQLFDHYIAKAQILNKRGVFSGPANMSRLKAQLGLDANKFLNVLTIRRYISEDMRSSSAKGYNKKITQRKADIPQISQPFLSYHAMVEVSRPKTPIAVKPILTIEEEIQEINKNIPDLDITELSGIVENIPVIGGTTSRLSDLDIFPKKTRKQKETAPKTEKSSEEIVKVQPLLQRADSLPQLYQGDLLEELGMEEVGGRRSTMSLAGSIEATTDCSGDAPDKKTDVYTNEQTLTTSHNAADDLQTLIKRSADSGASDKDNEDLPPLIQAFNRSAKNDDRHEQIKKKLEILEKKEIEYRKAEQTQVEEPKYPQPATISTKMPNKMTVRTSDVRVSDRVCLSSVTLDKFFTVYNDLIDEIDAATVKELDSNLFLGDEITEVYNEIMKTVPSDHLSLENDLIIEPCANKVNLTSTMASTSLAKKPKERILNPKLYKANGPPWGHQGREEWARASRPPNAVGMSDFKHLESSSDNDRENGLAAESTIEQPVSKQAAPSHMQDYMARSYASWLAWWKSTINSDDYMKYLSNQETDYMSAVFHFYNSDDDASEDEEKATSHAKQSTKNAQLKEREEKLELLRSKKNEYKGGMWNVNSVLMGGLGNDPELEDDEFDKASKAPSGTDVTAASKLTRTKTRVTSRRSHKLSQSLTEEEDLVTGRDTETRSPTALSKRTRTTKGQIDAGATKDNTGAQDRLERVWSMLGMPDASKLNMAIKYSSDRYHSLLDQAITEWEKATELILRRESLMAKLEQFERGASNPNRFFEKGNRGSSVARLEEAKIRSNLYKRIDNVDVQLKNLLDQIQRQFQDCLTFQGRPYLEKMKWDRTEMLFWLQEERKQQAMEMESYTRQFGSPVNLSTVQLEPITPSTTYY